jgi:hypothetical protein
VTLAKGFRKGTLRAAEAAQDQFKSDLAALPSDLRLVRVGRNKAPIAGTGWYDADNYSPDEAAALNGSGPPAWGVKSGPCSGVVVLDLDADGWRESFEEVTGHSIRDLPATIAWSSGKPGRSGRMFQVDPEWWPHLRNRRPFTRPWREGDPLGKNGKPEPVTLWELRWDRHQAVIIGAHPETGSYRWLPAQSPHEIQDPARAPDWLLEALLAAQEHPDAPPVQPTADDAARAVAMLACIPAADHSSYDSWLKVGMALHHTDPGLLAAWVDWSRPMASFDEAECLAKWESFGKGHKGRAATIRTLHYLAKQGGYQEPKRSRKRSSPPPPPAAGGSSPQEQQQQEHPSSYSKPLTMATHAVLLQLPQRIGQPRLNIRTRDVHLPDRIISADDAARLYLQLSSDREKWPKETTFDAVQHLAAAASFDPVAEYLEGIEASTEPLPPEEWRRLDLLLFNIDDPVAAAFLPRFFITAVARTFQPGCMGRQWPVLIGEKGIGKSDLPKLLFNIPNLPQGFVDNPGDLQRDGLMKAHRSWCVELAELNGITRRGDKEHLKAFLSERVDTYRAPYSRAPDDHARRFVFWGTSNGPPMNESDPRFVCIPLPDRMLPFAAVEAARDALWARAMAEYRAGTCWHTVSDQFKSLLEQRNEDHTVTDPWAEQVAEYLERRKKALSLPVSVPDLMTLLKLDSSQRNNAAAVRLIELAGSLGWVKGKRRPAPGLAQRQGLWPKDWK